MPDPIFENPRLVAIYDSFDGNRPDLEHYIAIINEFQARSVLDIGCGTGCFACLLGSQGFEVIGLEPARASLDFARRKPNADRVRWILGDSSVLPPLAVDIALMTGNVAQVFISDLSWNENLRAIKRALRPDAHLIFEVRDPAKRAWLEWTREKTYGRRNVPGIGLVESWCEVIAEMGELVSFRWTYKFESDGEIITSDSTLRFRSRENIERTLTIGGYVVREIRDAPDRPGKELVFIASSS
jgi:SAM-dependent methyltransferase